MLSKMSLKAKIKQVIPPVILNNLLLKFPFLYRSKLVHYESNLQRNHGIEDLLKQLDKVLNIEGDIIECGCLSCGTSIIMANYLSLKQIHSKKIYACDSFKGFDKDELAKERKLGLTNSSGKAFTSNSYEYVREKIKKLGLEDIVIPVKGFFKNTLPHLIESKKFSFVLIDCNLKDNTIYCAETIWPNLVKGGCILFDDYQSEGFRGVRIGIEFFVDKYKNEFSEYILMNRLYYIYKK